MRGGMDNPVPDSDHTSAVAGPTARTNGTYGPPAGDPRFPGEPPGATPTSDTHAAWPAGGVLQVQNVQALVQRLCNGGPHPTTAHHTDAASKDRAVAAGNAGTTGPHGPSISGLSPRPYGGGLHRWGPRPFTRSTRRGDIMMRPGPRLAPGANAKATTGAGSRAPHDRQECQHNPNPNPNPNPNHNSNPNSSSSANAPGEPGATGDDLGANDGTPIQLRCLATSVDALTAGDVATEPGALAVRAWAEGTRRNWRRDLQWVGRTTLMYADHDAPSALAKHLTMLAAQGRQSATLRGVVTSVRMCETLGIIDAVVTPLHWAICKAADRAYAHTPPRRIWDDAHTLQTLDARTSGPYISVLPWAWLEID